MVGIIGKIFFIQPGFLCNFAQKNLHFVPIFLLRKIRVRMKNKIKVIPTLRYGIIKGVFWAFSKIFTRHFLYKYKTYPIPFFNLFNFHFYTFLIL